MRSPERPSPASTPRDAAVEIVRRLSEAGFTAYLAGGCVRDCLLGLDPKDYDVATDARPEQVRDLFPRAQGVGEAFGVMLVRLHGHMIEVATFRTDASYSDRRRPDSVTFSDAEHDAQRRDFTINGLFEDPLTDRIIDYVGGRSDLETRLVRAIGDPETRLEEDRLRMLRAVRFAARFGFTIEAQTAEAIQAAAGELAGVSRERIGQEVRWMLSHPNRAVAAWETQYLGLDRAVLEEPSRTPAPHRLARLPDVVGYSTALAAWLLDRWTGRQVELAEVAGRWSSSLVLSNVESRALRRTLDLHGRIRHQWGRLGVARQKRTASSKEFPEALMILRAEDAQAFVDVRRQVEQLAETGLAPTPLIDGMDLIGCGMEPGPLFQRVLEGVYDAQLEGLVETRDEALELARALEQHGSEGR